MKIAITTSGRFHSFDQAAELERYGLFGRIFTGYPPFKLSDERIPRKKMSCVWGMHAPLMASYKLPFQAAIEPLRAELFEIARDRVDRRARRHLDDCDGLIGLSGSGLKSGLEIQRRGGVYVCDRGSTHIRFQDRILREEAEIVGAPVRPIHDYAVMKELAEYAAADAIFTPSTFTYRTFIDYGVSAEKLKLVPYGANTEAFRPGGPKSQRFTVLFAGQLNYRKGLHYLLKAWADWGAQNAELRIAGGRTVDFDVLARWAGGTPKGVVFLGHLGRTMLAKEMAAAHALVMPSIEEGLPLVMCQAMACGTPVIATVNAGAETLFSHGQEGFVGPARSTDFLVQSFEALAADAATARSMSDAALRRSGTFGDVHSYGARMIQCLRDIYAKKGLGSEKGLTSCELAMSEADYNG